MLNPHLIPKNDIPIARAMPNMIVMGLCVFASNLFANAKRVTDMKKIR
ncbi:MAG: hypothetical protein U9R34_04210 [Nanoarchaeota archaeon]|nr:hypothetical protein [Nanoarchaeota archaeon]